MGGIRQICPELAAKARDELLEVEKRIPEDIKALRDWVLKQPHLKARTNDQFLLSFLRGSKHSMEKAKEKIDNYYTIRSLVPEVFIRPFDDKALRLAMIGPVIPLSKTMQIEGPRIFLSRYGLVNPREFNVVDLIKHYLRILDILIHEDDNSIIGGLLFVADLADISTGLVKQFNISLMKTVKTFIEKAICLRLKGVHVVNASMEVTVALRIFRSLLNKKHQERIFLHSSFESIYEHIPKELLPKEYGGENGCLQDITDEWVQRLSDYKDFYDEEIQYKSHENLRHVNNITSDSFFGLDGSFRKLEID